MHDESCNEIWLSKIERDETTLKLLSNVKWSMDPFYLKALVPLKD
jgi:hypothetical protein